MVKVTVTGALVLFVNAPLILPEPFAAIPVTDPVLFLVQLYTVPATELPLKTIVVIAFAEQIVCDDGLTVALGVRLTVTGVPAEAAEEQPSDEAITV